MNLKKRLTAALLSAALALSLVAPKRAPQLPPPPARNPHPPVTLQTI